MTTILLAFILMVIVVGAMAVGVAMGRKPISGSCGGLAQLGIDGECEICGGNPNACDTAAAANPAKPQPNLPLNAVNAVKPSQP